MKENIFSDVTLLITHYNRSNSLERLLKAFKDLDVIFNEIIVSDDGSQPEHVNYIKKLVNDYNFTLITAEVNKGLGNNINKGQLAVKTPYTLYVQEDFVPLAEFIPHFKDALSFMGEEASLDIVRFYSYDKYPSMIPYKAGFSEMVYQPLHLDKNKVYYYSDHPHLRRDTFFEKFGKYREGVKVDKTEYSMCVSFLRGKGRGLFYNDFQSLFLQVNSSSEPSTVQRNNWKQSDNKAIAFGRWLYRYIKYTYDVAFNDKLRG
ncbi:MAG: glycosyltransferase [Bacteroidota bacterium]